MRRLRTVRPNSTFSVSKSYEAQSYFQILREAFQSQHALPPPLSAFLVNGYFDKFFHLKTKIGSGGYGSVYKVEHILAGIKLAEYAVKIIPVGEFNWYRKAINEVQLLETLSNIKHPFILNYKHCWLEEYQTANFGPKIPCLFILMEYSPLGSLDSILAHGKKGKDDIRELTYGERWQIFLVIALAIRHLHSSQIMHRDLKLSNVLAFNDSHYHPIPMRFALCDFGTAAAENNIGNAKRTGATGTVETMAPELLLQNDSGDYIYKHSYGSDIWSLGVILFTLFTKRSPFGGNDGEDRLRSFRDVDTLAEQMGIYVDKGTLEWKWIRKMMDKEPKRRVTIEKFLQDETIYEMCEQYGFAELIESRHKHTVVSSPSYDELKHSIPLPLTCDMNNNDDESFPEIFEDDDFDISQINEIKPTLGEWFRKIPIEILIFLAASSASSSLPRSAIYALLAVFVWFIKPLALVFPILITAESVTGITDFNIFTFLLVLILALLILSKDAKKDII